MLLYLLCRSWTRGRSTSIVNLAFAVPELVSVLKLASAWGFARVKALATAALQSSSELDAFDAIELGTTYCVPALLPRAYAALALRAPSLSEDEEERERRERISSTSSSSSSSESDTTPLPLPPR